MPTQLLVQAAIFVLSGAAIWLVGGVSDNAKRWGYLLGLAGQPFWAYSAYRGEQWGILLLTAWYTIAWGRGLWNHWSGLRRALGGR